MKNNKTLYASIILYLMMAGSFLIVLIAFIYLLSANDRIKYDCTISEFSPDFSKKMKQECKKR